MQDFLVKAVAVVVLLGGLIFVHELGHFLVAKLMGVKVLRFSLGFGPRLVGFQWGETEYRIAVLPLGGYVKMAGEDPSAELAPEDRGRGFLEQSPYRRLFIALAGPAMNLLLPFALFAAVIWSLNGSSAPSATVGTVIPGSPAEQAGLAPGDRIVSVEAPGQPAQPIRNFFDLVDAVTPHPEEVLVLKVERKGNELPPVPVRTLLDESSNGLEMVRRGVIGISPYYTPALAAPVAPGVAGPLQPFDLVVSAGGKPVANAPELLQALAAASCRPVDLEVVRESPRRIPGAVLADHRREKLSGVPSCAEGGPSLRVVDPLVSPAIAAVEPGGPAERAGIRRGDVVAAVNGKPVHTFNDLATVVNRELAGGKIGTFTLVDGRSVQVAAEEVRTRNDLTGKDDVRWTIGLFPDQRSLVDERSLLAGSVPVVRGPAEVARLALRQTGAQIRNLVLGIVAMVTGKISTGQMGGIIQIVQETGRAVEQGWGMFLTFMAFISVNLGLMNLLPVPVLDGGHIAQAVVEVITRRPLSLRAREIANIVGLVLLVFLFLFAFRNDINRQLEDRRPSVTEPAR
ncbi:MAG TPA: site-2 protease family protein [Anaeromyxobacter sp.]|nr:site-2 protease family protein [Anaeromyxobacter sp.]